MQRSGSNRFERIENYRSRVAIQDAVLRMRLAVEDLICESRRSVQDLIRDVERNMDDLRIPLCDGTQENRRQARIDADRWIRLERQRTDEWKGEMIALHFRVARALDRLAEEQFRKADL